LGLGSAFSLCYDGHLFEISTLLRRAKQKLASIWIWNANTPDGSKRNVLMAKDKNISQLLLNMAREGQMVNAQELLRQLSPTAELITDADGNTALHWAVMNKMPALIRLLLMYHYERNTLNNDYYTPVVLAAQLHHWSCLEVFIQNCQIGRTDGLDTALLYTVKEDQYLLAKRLLQNNVPCNAKWTSTQFTPLHWAVENNDPNMLSLLLTFGADQTIEDITNFTPFERALSKENWSCVIALCQFPSLDPKYYSAALVKAAKANQYQAVKALLGAGADPNVNLTNEKNYALHWAVINDAPEMFALLKAHGAQDNVYEQNQLTPIHLAFKHNKVQLAAWFNALKVDVTIKDGTDKQLTAIQASINWQSKEFCNAFYSQEIEIQPLQLAIAQNQPQKISELLTSEPELLTRRFTSNQQTPINYAISLNQVEVIKTLVTHMNATDVAKAFELACQSNQWQCAQAIDKIKAITHQLNQEFYHQLSWYHSSHSNTDIKKAFIKKAELMAEYYDCDKQTLYNSLANSQVAKYRQFLFWKSEPTNTSSYFFHQAKLHANIEPQPVSKQVEEPKQAVTI
jgi:ankyrin repeat protein